MDLWPWVAMGVFISLVGLVVLMVFEGIRLVNHDRLSTPQSIIAACIATSMHFMFALAFPAVARDMRQKHRGMLTFGFDDTDHENENTGKIDP